MQMTFSANQFDFDSSDHVAPIQKSPACKAINSPAGLWIGSDNQELAGWNEGQVSDSKLHNVETKNYDTEGYKISIPGILFRAPKLLVVGRSPLLGGRDRKAEGLYNKDLKNDPSYKTARKYLLIFLDSKNQPLHISPIQLTAWSVFQVHFDTQLMKFRQAFTNAHAKATGQAAKSKTELWHSMCVFAPQFKSELRGSDDTKKSMCCITTGFEEPTPENWLTLCVGKSEIAQEIALLHISMQNWWERGIKSSLIREQKPLITRESLMSQSDSLMQELGWEISDGQDFIHKNYGKRSRITLTDSELLDFVGRLQASGDLLLKSTGVADDEYPPYQ